MWGIVHIGGPNYTPIYIYIYTYIYINVLQLSLSLRVLPPIWPIIRDIIPLPENLCGNLDSCHVIAKFSKTRRRRDMRRFCGNYREAAQKTVGSFEKLPSTHFGSKLDCVSALADRSLLVCPPRTSCCNC